MSLKRAALAASLLTCAAAASAATPITLASNGGNQWSGSFAAAASGANSFTLDLSSLAGLQIQLNAAVTSTFGVASGFDVTGITFDGYGFAPLINTSAPVGVDYWVFQIGNISADTHTLVVTGNLIGGNVGFGGTVSIQAQPVPEPETYALMLAGLGVVGVIARRRGRR